MLWGHPHPHLGLVFHLVQGSANLPHKGPESLSGVCGPPLLQPELCCGRAEAVGENEQGWQETASDCDAPDPGPLWGGDVHTGDTWGQLCPPHPSFGNLAKGFPSPHTSFKSRPGRLLGTGQAVFCGASSERAQQTGSPPRVSTESGLKGSNGWQLWQEHR